MKLPFLLTLPTFVALAPLTAKTEKPAATKPVAAAGAADTAVAAIPTAPGSYKKLKCPKNPALTYDIYLPKGYTPAAPAGKGATDGGEACPALFISDPHKNPGFRGLEKWATVNHAVLITINDSQNGPYAPIQAAQDAVLDAVKAYNLHPCLRFATGYSGGGAASANMVHFHNKEFAGVILQCHSAYVESPSYICYGYIGGVKDTTHPDALVRAGAVAARKGGRYVQDEHLPMGHVWAPVPVVSAMLDNMLLYARLTHPGIGSTERRNAEKLPDALLNRAADETDPAKACRILEPLLGVDAFKSRPFFAAALDAWCAARVKTIEALAGGDAFKALTDDDTRARFSACKGKARPAVDTLRKKIEGDDALKEEVVAWKDFEKYADAHDRECARGALNAKEQAEWKTKFGKLAKKYAGTHAGEKAAALAK